MGSAGRGSPAFVAGRDAGARVNRGKGNRGGRGARTDSGGVRVPAAPRDAARDDPTVIYGLGSEFDGNLRKSDLRRDTPYNTYVRKGLPPTPIAIPSAAAIDAVVAPLEDGSLYFVATGDGRHVFSTNYEDHRKAVVRYQIRRKRPQPAEGQEGG